MNEVRNVQIANEMLVRSASSKGAANAEASTSGKSLPPQAENIDAAAVDIKPQQEVKSIDLAVVELNEFVQSVQRDLHFTVDEELDQTVVKVLDGDSGELIRQIPEEVFLELARKLREDGELRLINAFG